MGVLSDSAVMEILYMNYLIMQHCSIHVIHSHFNNSIFVKKRKTCKTELCCNWSTVRFIIAEISRDLRKLSQSCRDSWAELSSLRQ